MSFVTIACPKCGRFHGTLAHDSSFDVTTLVAANVNFECEVQPAVRKRLTAREAMAATKNRYSETLDYLT